MNKRLNISWKEISRMTHSLSEGVDRPTHVAALSRGGLTVGVMLSHHWDVPLVPIMWSTRDHAKASRDDALRVLNVLSEDTSRTLLLVDDICDSGKTLKELTDFLFYHQVPGVRERVTTATLFHKEHSEFQPDFPGDRVEDDVWVVFPWEAPLVTK